MPTTSPHRTDQASTTGEHPPIGEDGGADADHQNEEREHHRGVATHEGGVGDRRRAGTATTSVPKKIEGERLDPPADVQLDAAPAIVDRAPEQPEQEEVNKVRPRAAPHAPPPEYSPSTPRMSAGPAALDQGVPVCRVWKTNDGHPREERQAADEHGDQAPQVVALARSRPPSRATAWRRGRSALHPRPGTPRPWYSSQSPTTMMRYSPQ